MHLTRFRLSSLIVALSLVTSVHAAPPSADPLTRSSSATTSTSMSRVSAERSEAVPDPFEPVTATPARASSSNLTSTLPQPVLAPSNTATTPVTTINAPVNRTTQIDVRPPNQPLTQTNVTPQVQRTQNGSVVTNVTVTPNANQGGSSTVITQVTPPGQPIRPVTLGTVTNSQGIPTEVRVQPVAPAAPSGITTTNPGAIGTSVGVTTAPGLATPTMNTMPPTASGMPGQPLAVDPTVQAPRVMIPLTQNMPIKRVIGKGKKARTVVSNASSNAPIEQMDVTDIDKQISDLAAHAQHYPPRFPDRRTREVAERVTRDLIDRLDNLAVLPNASYEVLLRAGKVNAIGRNLDLGSTATLKSSIYLKRAIDLKPKDGEANYWYGSALAEGGGFKEGLPYLNRALTAGYDEALLSMANVHLNLEKSDEAIRLIERYRAKFPDDPRLNGMTEAVNNKSASIW